MGNSVDVIVIGAGASGLMCAIETGKRGRTTLVLDHGKGPGRKILIAGGGRCNFTNLDVKPINYVSANPHFCKSALSRYTQWDFLELVNRHSIAYQERLHGQLFCEHKARDLLDALLAEFRDSGSEMRFGVTIESITKTDAGFVLRTTQGTISCASLVVATGGLSIPTTGASPFGYKIAEQFGLAVQPVTAGLVPFTLNPEDKEKLAELPGIAVPATVTTGKFSYTENLLFTHRGLSGPVILQVSNHWNQGQEIVINLLPGQNLSTALERARAKHPQILVRTWLCELLPKRLVAAIASNDWSERRLTELTPALIQKITQAVQEWTMRPAGTEGYRTAEVTRGGVDCNALSSKTMEAREVPGLYFIGEVVDVTGWLGGFNLQWAWASGWCAGQYA